VPLKKCWYKFYLGTERFQWQKKKRQLQDSNLRGKSQLITRKVRVSLLNHSDKLPKFMTVKVVTLYRVGNTLQLQLMAKIAIIYFYQLNLFRKNHYHLLKSNWIPSFVYCALAEGFAATGPSVLFVLELRTKLTSLHVAQPLIPMKINSHPINI
jgi:hypothetical protein